MWQTKRQNVLLERIQVLGAANADHAQRVPSVQTMDCHHTFSVQMALTLMKKTWSHANNVMLVSSAPVLECKLLRNAQMEHTVTQPVPDIAFCVLKDTGGFVDRVP